MTVKKIFLGPVVGIDEPMTAEKIVKAELSKALAKLADTAMMSLGQGFQTFDNTPEGEVAYLKTKVTHLEIIIAEFVDKQRAQYQHLIDYTQTQVMERLQELENNSAPQVLFARLEELALGQKQEIDVVSKYCERLEMLEEQTAGTNAKVLELATELFAKWVACTTRIELLEQRVHEIQQFLVLKTA
jgi:TolA-binding protein